MEAELKKREDAGRHIFETFLELITSSLITLIYRRQWIITIIIIITAWTMIITTFIIIPISKFNNQNHEVKPTYQVYSRADCNYALTIRDGKVILAPSNHSDPRQHWYKEHKFGTQVKDAIGLPSFALVNKATGEAIQHTGAAAQPLQLIKYEADGVDHSILWSGASINDDNGDQYKAIRMVNNIGLNMDAFRAIQQLGGVQDGTRIVLWEWNGGDNQRWNIIPY